MKHLVIRTPIPEGAIDIAATFDADRAARRRDRRAKAKRSWIARIFSPKTQGKQHA